MSDVAKAEWTTAEIDDFPDSSFLYVEPGGKKDASGKTEPRSLRHFPVKDKDGKVDATHVRDALSRIPQSSVPEEAKAKAKAEAERMLAAADKAATKRLVGAAAVVSKIDVVAKVAGVPFGQITDALCEALEDKYPSTDDSPKSWNDGPWIRDVFDDKVVFSFEGQLLAVGYTFADGKATLSGEPAPVNVQYVPAGGAAPAAKQPATPDAEAGKRAIESELFRKSARGADAALEALAKRATPPAPKTVRWPSDMSGERGRPTLARR